MPLRSTELLSFGKPTAGSPRRQAEQTLGIALPLEALVWAEASGGAWIGYNDPGVAGSAARAWPRHHDTVDAIPARAGAHAKFAGVAAGG
jgi:hypothetical protein